jgi:hypothetical protein
MTLALGLLAAGTHERIVAAAMIRKAQGERQAEAAVAAALREWSTRAVAAMQVGDPPRTLPPGSATATRVDSGLYLVRAEARVPGSSGAVVRTAGALVRTLPSPASALPGAITAATRVTVEGGHIDGAPGDTTGTGVGGEGGGAPGVLAPDVEVRGAAAVTGAPPVKRALPPPPPDPDPLAPPLAEGIADLRPAERTVTPGPVSSAGECVPGPGNWGAAAPDHPCHGLLPMVFVDHDLTLAGGVASGILVVQGDLRIIDGAVLEGVVVVHGQLEISGGTIRGAVRARSVLLVDGAVIRDDLALSRALAAPALDRPFRPLARWWVPEF